MSTIRLTGSGYLDCRKCDRRVVFPRGDEMIVYDLGNSVIVKSAMTLVVLHRCGQLFRWVCPACGLEPDSPMLTRRQRRRDPGGQMIRDCVCGSRFVQRRVVSDEVVVG